MLFEVATMTSPFMFVICFEGAVAFGHFVSLNDFVSLTFMAPRSLHVV